MMASPLTFLMMATSVVNTRDLMRRPKMRMPLHSEIQWGTASKWLRRVPLYVGNFFIGVVPPADETGLGVSGQVLDVDLIDLGRAASQVELPPELYRGVAAGLQLG